MDKGLIITIGIIVVLVALLVGAIYFTGGFNNDPLKNIVATPLPEGIVLFFGADCPHCKNVEDFVAQNKIEEKVKFTSLEVPFNGKTSSELLSNVKLAMQLADNCKLDIKKGISLPFLWDGAGACTAGDTPIIEFFKNKAGIK